VFSESRFLTIDQKEGGCSYEKLCASVMSEDGNTDPEDDDGNQQDSDYHQLN
jgi:hypothetical protein